MIVVDSVPLLGSKPSSQAATWSPDLSRLESITLQHCICVQHCLSGVWTDLVLNLIFGDLDCCRRLSLLASSPTLAMSLALGKTALATFCFRRPLLGVGGQKTDFLGPENCLWSWFFSLCLSAKLSFKLRRGTVSGAVFFTLVHWQKCLSNILSTIELPFGFRRT